MGEFINGTFVPLKSHVKENPQNFERFGAEWTPTIIISDPKGKEHHRIEGFLPANEFRRQLDLGLAHVARAMQNFDDAESRYRKLAEGDDDVAAESLYWAGVSRYKGSNDGSALADTAKAFGERFTNSSWATKASIWK